MELYITTGLIMLASLSGLIFLIKNFGDWIHNNAKFVIAFSSGIFAVVTYDLLIESFEFSNKKWFAILSVLIGFFIFEIIERIFPESHHHEDDESHCLHSTRKIVYAKAFHNIGDGILLALAFAVDVNIGMIAAFGIFVHEFVQDISEFLILKLSGISTKKALLINFLVSTTIIIGVLFGMYLSKIESMIGIFLGLAAGSFLHLVFADLIPNSIENSKKDKKYFIYIFLIAAGILTILAIAKAKRIT